MVEEIELPPKREMLTRTVSETKDSESLLEEVPQELWTRYDNDVGCIIGAAPLVVKLKPGARWPNVHQYPLRKEAAAGIAPVIKSLKEQGIIVETSSPCNTPILPVKKPQKDKWRFVQDLREVNEVIQNIHPVVPSAEVLITSIPANSTHFTVIDLGSAFFSVPIAKKSQFLFAFTYKGLQYTWTVLPQGFADKPTFSFL